MTKVQGSNKFGKHWATRGALASFTKLHPFQESHMLTSIRNLGRTKARSSFHKGVQNTLQNEVFYDTYLGRHWIENEHSFKSTEINVREYQSRTRSHDTCSSVHPDKVRLYLYNFNCKLLLLDLANSQKHRTPLSPHHHSRPAKQSREPAKVRAQGRSSKHKTGKERSLLLPWANSVLSLILLKRLYC